jgi:urea transporter
MTANIPATSSSKGMVWTGRVISAIVVLMLTFSAIMKMIQHAEVTKEFGRLGWPNIAFGIGVVEIVCAILYAIPQTTVLGAILLTGYLGGAIATHVRIDDPFIGPAIGGVLVWLGVFLRDPRLRSLVPLRSRI